MAVNKIEIKKFTVFNNVTIQAGSGLNVIIGENGTGKTHLLKLIFIAKYLRPADGHLPSGECLINEVSNYDLESLLYSLANGVFKLNSDKVSNLLFQHNISKCMADGTNFLAQAAADDIISRTPPHNPVLNSESYAIYITSDKLHQPVFIPTKEMLSMSKLLYVNEKYSKAMGIDQTLTDIILEARNILLDTPPTMAQEVTATLEKYIRGKVYTKDDPMGGISFWIEKHNGMNIPFSMEAEGIRKLGLLWRLLMNGSINEDTVLLWDEPEANISPKLTPVLVDTLMELSRQGVQIFIATHDYAFAKYFEIRQKENDNVLFHSLYKTGDDVRVETKSTFKDLKENVIISSLDSLIVEVIEGRMGD